MDLLEAARALIAADTVSHKGTSAAVDVLRPLYVSAGLATLVQEVTKGGARHQNLLGTLPGTEAESLLLVTHLDTVDPGAPELWTRTGANPWALTRDGDTLYGLGSADTKLDALCKLTAAETFRDRKLRRSLQLLGTFEEEVGCKGALHFAASPDFRAKFVACSEPSELTIIHAHKGYAVVTCEVTLPEGERLDGPFIRITTEGKSAHSSTPHLGINAIERALGESGRFPLVSLSGGTVSNKVPARCVRVEPQRTGLIGEACTLDNARNARPLANLAARLFSAWKALAAQQQPEQHTAFDPSISVVNWGVAHIEGTNARLTFDCRLLPGHEPTALIQSFTREANALVTSAGGRLRIDIERASPAMELLEPSALLEGARAACRDIGLPDTPAAKPTNTEAGVFARAGVEAIVFGPGRSTGNAHTPNEHNLLSQLEKAIEFYKALISRLCL
ncbi:MAG: M20/M25/M40 family metallo-hydrolase [Myxococcaceae bacterium]